MKTHANGAQKGRESLRSLSRCLNLVAFIVPLSTSIFAVASSEMQRAVHAADLIEGKTTGETEATDSEETPSDTGDSSGPRGETSEDEEAADAWS